MKRIIAVILASLFCIASAFSVLAAYYTIAENGDAVYETAIGYCFDIDDVNGTITGEDATIITTNEALANVGSKWAIWFTAEELDDSGIYRVHTDGTAMGGTIPAITLLEGEIFVAIHSATSNPDQASQYPNWEDKVAALAVKSGDCLAFDGIDLDAGTCENGRMLVVEYEDVLAGNIVFPDAEEESIPPVESEITSEPEESETVSDVSVEEESNIATDNAPEPDKDKSQASADDEIKTSVIKLDSGVDTWVWILIGGIAAVIVVAIVCIVLLKKKKNA